MKKKSNIGKIIFLIFLFILIVTSAFIFITYQTLNNTKQYEDTFLSDETGEYTFQDFVTYNTSTHIAHVEVPKEALKGFVDKIIEDINMPEGLTINRVGISLNDDQTITIIPEIKYQKLIATCPVITIAYKIEEDHLEFIYKDLFLVNEKISRLINDKAGLVSGSKIATVNFPKTIMDFHQCPFMLKYVSELKSEGDKISCNYDVYQALLELYKTDNDSGKDNPWFKQNLESLKNLSRQGYKIVE